MGLVEMLLLAIGIWICFYALVERICRCIEYCANAKAFAASVSKGMPMGMKLDDFLKMVNDAKKEKEK